MQQLLERNTYTPQGASQAPCSVTVSLNRDKSLSEHGLKTSDNSLDVNQRASKHGQDLRVFVINMRGEPLMPTTPRKARVLIKGGKAKVVKRTPFTIQLKYSTGFV